VSARACPARSCRSGQLRSRPRRISSPKVAKVGPRHSATAVRALAGTHSRARVFGASERIGAHRRCRIERRRQTLSDSPRLSRPCLWAMRGASGVLAGHGTGLVHA
jgi:hypothetical protein